jgi:hypothetical protein
MGCRVKSSQMFIQKCSAWKRNSLALSLFLSFFHSLPPSHYSPFLSLLRPSLVLCCTILTNANISPELGNLTSCSCLGGSRVAQRSKALHLSARGVTTDPGLIPGCITPGRDWECHRAAHNWPSAVRVWPG